MMIERQPRPDFGDVPAARRRNMASNKGTNTKPEILVRKLLHRLGYRYRIHAKNLAGRPDIVFPARSKIIDIRGCFWHRHEGCAAAAIPRTRTEFWQDKFNETLERDRRNLLALKAAGWDVLVVWECEVRDARLSEQLQAFLGPPRSGKNHCKLEKFR